MEHNGPIYWPPRVSCGESERPGAVVTGALGQGKSLHRKRYTARPVLRSERVTVDSRTVVIGALGQGKSSTGEEL